ncbi:hypothetical protein QBC45DRAFT_126340 [Copromyces sp. CBS 386.78]|nr:hypothetical protein QBC45DRAFT_126340 [Copromyces sp. CBS 386.78]
MRIVDAGFRLLSLSLLLGWDLGRSCDGGRWRRPQQSKWCKVQAFWGRLGAVTVVYRAYLRFPHFIQTFEMFSESLGHIDRYLYLALVPACLY